MKLQTQLLLPLLLLQMHLFRCGVACKSQPPAKVAAGCAAVPAAATSHVSIECNRFQRPVHNCTGEASCQSFKCVCTTSGHVYVPGRGCRDVDECRELPMPCSGAKVTCQNVKGGYECICNEEGHRYHPFKGCGEHNSCHFPFKYKGTYYHHCIRSQHNRLWCSQTADYDKDNQFVNCAAEFLTMHCHFPFKYQGKEHHACIGQGEEKWCSTTYNYDVDRRWDICY